MDDSIRIGHTFLCSYEACDLTRWQEDITQILNITIRWRAHIADSQQGILYTCQLLAVAASVSILERVIVNRKANTICISLVIDVEHVDHAVTVNVSKVELASNALRYLFSRDEAEGAKPCHIVDEFILLGSGLPSLLDLFDCRALDLYGLCNFAT